ncbi:CPBP family intramembrane glutamic endopeptidase [Lysinibacillus sp. SGAir0095]|uniref:CPBP family intramembrane glutamic endopeptidase n=1 Tax=Lysinibacillus sp. SGAir0095 TaxID=2070463 RepID=UPI0010CD3F9E|nr:CPBP family intramembrane glutamic endopeptidase [Lysinibacillus sp. SGAir0095]QCR32493.1 CPBP family intramembrane metalloprotease [Lysinibacillus sp. SGAir0095]
MVFCLWIIIIFTLLYEPIIGYFEYQKFKIAVREDGNVRTKYYKKLIVDLWIPTISILLLVIVTEINLKDIGIAMPTINTGPQGSVVTYSILIIVFLYLLIVLYNCVGYHFSSKIRKKFIQAKESQLNTVSFSEIMPVTREEKHIWNYVSLTAGVTEEIIYRGFLIFAFSYLFPDLSIWLVLIFTSLLFGLAHTYQGFSGVIRTTVVGVLFACLYIGIGSILPLIVLHFLIDYVAKLGD